MKIIILLIVAIAIIAISLILFGVYIQPSIGDSTIVDDMELSVPDDWKEPHEDNYNGGFNSEYKPDIPPYTPAEGDTVNNGEEWEFPEIDIENDGVSGEIGGTV